MPTNQVENTIPILPVRDLPSSRRYYTETLGFTLDWSGDFVCSVSRDGHAIMLSQLTAGSGPGWVWIGLHDDALFKEFRSRGVTVHQEARNEAWAYEMKFADPDGNILWLGTETKTDQPLAGD